MAETSSAARSAPLDGVAPLTHPALLMRPLPAATRLSLRVTVGAPANFAALKGLDLGGAINTWTGAAWTASLAGIHALRLGPDEWLVLAPDGDAEPLAASLTAALSGRPHAIVDVSHRFASLEIAGTAAEDIVSAGCPLDLDARAFPTGTATRSLLGKAEIVLARTDDRPGFRLEVARSLAAYVWDFLAEAARDVVEN
ncbi:MAG: sarcosine oxidase subunit gamma family protein [Hyphomicrobiaceae bacterium]